MRIYGIDFTGAPKRGKWLPCVTGRLAGDTLHIECVTPWGSFEPFEALLRDETPSVMALDFPFSLPPRVVADLGWDKNWQEYAKALGAMSKDEFGAALKTCRAKYPKGDKEPKRSCDALLLPSKAAKVGYIKSYGLSPINRFLWRMVHAGIPQLAESGAYIPGLLDDNSKERIIVEAYPAIYPHTLFGAKRPYKKSGRPKNPRNTKEYRRENREEILAGLKAEMPLTIDKSLETGILADDKGDCIDSLICAVIAAHYHRSARHKGDAGVSEPFFALPPPHESSFAPYRVC